MIFFQKLIAWIFIFGLLIGMAVPTQAQTLLLKDRYFTPEEFAELFYQTNLPNLTGPISAAPITGNPDADRRIHELAKNRGYRLQRTVTDETQLVNLYGQNLQSAVIVDWLDLQAEAKKNGIYLHLFSAFRTSTWQRTLFLKRLALVAQRDFGITYSVEAVANGTLDNAIFSLLGDTAPPGFSKHQTGYAIDITDRETGMDYTRFGQSKAFEWLSANNYYNAKRFGFIPSYPVGLKNVGPKSGEAWELVWVGK